MKYFRFTGLLKEDGWMTPAYVDIGQDGVIQYLADQPNEDKPYEQVHGFALPGITNTHSHAFQYAMVGLTEAHSLNGAKDDFWSWRKAMYDLALNISPEQLENIAMQLYSEMLRHGYTHVVEFHYVHHDQNGKQYNNIAELSERLISAAITAGIKITLIPILYQKSGFGKSPLPEQRRFICPNISDFWKLIESCEQLTKNYTDTACGVGVHSLRAVEPYDISKMCQEIDTEKPFHIHLAEQIKEIEDCIEYLGKRPVEWFVENVELRQHHNLVHCTHLNDEEVRTLAQSEASVVLCPSTEGNLGDGIFRLREFQALGGNWSIGTDSHIGLNPFEELRLLDYGQRLVSHKRNTFSDSTTSNSGHYAFNQVIKNGCRATGSNYQDFFTIGNPFDAVIIDGTNPLIESSSTKHLLNTIIYSSDNTMTTGTIVNGKWIVRNGQHILKNMIKEKFKKSISELKFR